MRSVRFLSLVAAAAWLLLAGDALAQAPKTVTETIMVPARDAGVQLHARNKRPEGVANFASDRIVLFVHGATYNAESGFDVPLGGVSWMDYVAQRGWDVYAMDVRGYGRSTRPKEMSQPPAENPPVVNTDVLRISLLGGITYYEFDVTVTGQLSGTASIVAQVPAPLVGVLGQAKFGSLLLEVEASGLTFAAGDYDVSYLDFQVSVGFQFLKIVAVRAGYRLVSIDGTIEGFDVDGTLDGFFVGASVNF